MGDSPARLYPSGSGESRRLAGSELEAIAGGVEHYAEAI
jgi:hypothetical protein